MGTPLKIDIFIINNGYYLPKVPCTMVYDAEEKRGPTLFPMNFEFRRCGLQFGKLSHEQAHKVELYLKNHTVKENGNLGPDPPASRRAGLDWKD